MVSRAWFDPSWITYYYCCGLQLRRKRRNACHGVVEYWRFAYLGFTLLQGNFLFVWTFSISYWKHEYVVLLIRWIVSLLNLFSWWKWLQHMGLWVCWIVNLLALFSCSGGVTAQHAWACAWARPHRTPPLARKGLTATNYWHHITSHRPVLPLSLSARRRLSSLLDPCFQF
jgi:hypothetical protein